MATIGGLMVGCEKPHIHHYTSHKQMPTCTEHGLVVYDCDCGKSYSVSLYNLGHNFGEFERREEGPSCQAYLEEWSTCNRCGEWHSRMVENPYGGHVYRGGSYCATCGISFQYADKIIIDESVSSIDYYAFAHCGNLTELVLPQNITSIEPYAFYGCWNLEKVVIPDSVTYIGEYAFADCSSLTEIKLPKNLTAINTSTFSNCYNLPEIQLPETLGSIGDSAFYNCTGLAEMEFPQNIDWIGESAFSNCGGLKKVVIPQSVTQINNRIFSDCGGLEEVIIPNGVERIGYSAFSNCNALTEIVVPDSVTEMGESVFNGCNSLERLTLPFVGSNAYGWGDTQLTYTFGWNVPSSLKTVEITSMSGIPNDAFNGCSNIEEIILPEGLQQIASSTFSSCTKLTEIQIPETVTEIGDYAFYYCRNLTEIIIPESVGRIGYYAFCGCDSLQKITLPFVGERADDWGNTEFSYIFGWNVPYSLKTVEITSATSIPDYAFSSCSNIEEIILCNGIKEIGYEAFYYCSNLTRIVIPKSVTRIENWAFQGCSSLTIYCEAVSKPSGWDTYWNYDNRPIEWGYANKPITYSFETNGYGYIAPITSKGSISLPSLDRAGYLLEWYDNPEFEGSAITGRYYNEENVVLYAKWTDFASLEQSEGLSISNGKVDGVGSFRGEILYIDMPIDSWAFEWNDSIKTVIFGKNVTSIGDMAFYYCSNLKTVIFLSEEPPQIGSDVFGGTWDASDFCVYVPESALWDYQNGGDMYWRDYVVYAGKLQVGGVEKI